MNGKKILNNKPMVKTIVFIVGICILALSILYLSGALDDSSTNMKYNAESLCFISGYYDGVSNFTKIGPGKYSFVCDRSRNTRVEFNGYKGVLSYG
jgi:hypothetical protein